MIFKCSWTFDLWDDAHNINNVPSLPSRFTFPPLPFNVLNAMRSVRNASYLNVWFGHAKSSVLNLYFYIHTVSIRVTRSKIKKRKVY